MPDRERKRSERQGPSTQPVDEGIEGAIFDDRDTDRKNDAADVRDLDAAARGESRLAPRSGEGRGARQEAESRKQEAENDSGEETPPDIRPS
jgi:hypothetical protein